MKKIQFILLLQAVLLSGCFNTELIAPDNTSVKVMPATAPASYHEQYRNWYLLWGALPLFTTQPEELIAKNRLVEVRVQTADTLLDGIISYFSASITLVPQTVIVEGNRSK